MWSSIAAWSIENYNFQFSISKFRLRLLNLFRVSISQPQTYIRLILKDIIYWNKDQEIYFLCEKLLHLYAIGFCNKVLPNLHYWWSEELYSYQHFFKLLELVTYCDLCKVLVTNWRFVQQKKEGYYKIKSNWVLK